MDILDEEISFAKDKEDDSEVWGILSDISDYKED